MPKKSFQMIKEELLKAGGNARKAQMLIKKRLQEEPELTYDLVSPFLDGIIFRAIKRIQKGLPVSSAATKPMKKVKRPIKKVGSATAAQKLSNASMDSLLGQLAKNVSGEEGQTTTRTRRKPSKTHQDAMNKLIKASYSRRDT